MQNYTDITRAPRTQVNVFGAWVDPVTREEALNQAVQWCKVRARQYVVTPNLNACRLLRTNQNLSLSYDNAGLSLADGWPLVVASRLTSHPIRRRVTGSDFVVPLCKLLSENGYSVFLLGSSADVLASAANTLDSLTRRNLVVGTYSPPFGFERDQEQIDFINDKISQLKPHVVLVALGCPKQELWMAKNVKNLPIGFAIGIGGTLDFLAGKQRRAPQVFQSVGLEWFWRACTNPMRLGKRYIQDAAILPLLVLSHFYRHVISKKNIERQRLTAM